jgi:hypothetical protein
MIGVIEDDNGRAILQLGILRCTVSAIEFTLGHPRHSPMSLSKKLLTHERESLYSAANSAIWHSHHHAVRKASLKAREEDFVATLVTNGVLMFADRWISILQPKGIQLKISGVFCHGHPQVVFNSSKLRVELADLLVVHQHTANKRSTARAILIQAKMSADATHALPKSDKQLQLFTGWPPFEFVTGGLAPGMRDIKEKKGKGSRYALVLDKHAYPEEITWADQCPWGTCPATQVLSAERSLAKLLGDMLLGKDGRVFQLGIPKDDWSRTIQELLKITGKRTYKRTNIERGDTLRLAEKESVTAGIMFLAASPSFATANTRASNRSVSELYFGAVPMQGADGGNRDIFRQENDKLPEGGISALIIETKEGEQ